MVDCESRRRRPRSRKTGRWAAFSLVAGLGALVPVAPITAGAAEPTPPPRPGLAPTAAASGPFRTYDDKLTAIAEQAPEFGGLYVEADGSVRVVVTDTGAAAGARAEKAVGEVLGEGTGGTDRRIGFVKGSYRFRDLKTWHDRMAPGLLDLDGVVLTDIDERGNRLKVGVVDAAMAGQVKAQLARAGVPAAAVQIETMPAVTLDTLRDATTPKVAGIQIQNDNFGTCTLGFNARRAGVAGFVTASHCTEVQGGVETTLFWQPTKPTSCSFICLAPGIETVDPVYSNFPPIICPAGRVCRFSDASFSRYLIDSPSLSTQGRIARPASSGTINWNGTSTFRVTDELEPFMFVPATKVGRTTGMSTGIVMNTCANVNVANTNITMLCQDNGGYASSPGDSGSPVFFASGTDAMLMGVHWGGGGWFSPINNIEMELGALSTCASGFSC